MRIVNRTAFLALPPETVFAKYAPCVFEELLIKGESLENDFFYFSLVDAVDAMSSAEMVDKLHAAELEGANVPMNFWVMTRDGCFDYDQLFAVWDQQDVAGLIGRLQETQKPLTSGAPV